LTSYKAMQHVPKAKFIFTSRQYTKFQNVSTPRLKNIPIVLGSLSGLSSKEIQVKANCPVHIFPGILFEPHTVFQSTLHRHLPLFERGRMPVCKPIKFTSQQKPPSSSFICNLSTTQGRLPVNKVGVPL